MVELRLIIDRILILSASILYNTNFHLLILSLACVNHIECHYFLKSKFEKCGKSEFMSFFIEINL